MPIVLESYAVLYGVFMRPRGTDDINFIKFMPYVLATFDKVAKRGAADTTHFAEVLRLCHALEALLVDMATRDIRMTSANLSSRENDGSSHVLDWIVAPLERDVSNLRGIIGTSLRDDTPGLEWIKPVSHRSPTRKYATPPGLPPLKRLLRTRKTLLPDEWDIYARYERRSCPECQAEHLAADTFPKFYCTNVASCSKAQRGEAYASPPLSFLDSIAASSNTVYVPNDRFERLERHLAQVMDRSPCLHPTNVGCITEFLTRERQKLANDEGGVRSFVRFDRVSALIDLTHAQNISYATDHIVTPPSTLREVALANNVENLQQDATRLVCEYRRRANELKALRKQVSELVQVHNSTHQEQVSKHNQRIRARNAHVHTQAAYVRLVTALGQTVPLSADEMSILRENQTLPEVSWQSLSMPALEAHTTPTVPRLEASTLLRDTDTAQRYVQQLNRIDAGLTRMEAQEEQLKELRRRANQRRETLVREEEALAALPDVQDRTPAVYQLLQTLNDDRVRLQEEHARMLDERKIMMQEMQEAEGSYVQSAQRMAELQEYLASMSETQRLANQRYEIANEMIRVQRALHANELQLIGDPSSNERAELLRRRTEQFSQLAQLNASGREIAVPGTSTIAGIDDGAAFDQQMRDAEERQEETRRRNEVELRLLGEQLYELDRQLRDQQASAQLPEGGNDDGADPGLVAQNPNNKRPLADPDDGAQSPKRPRA